MHLRCPKVQHFCRDTAASELKQYSFQKERCNRQKTKDLRYLHKEIKRRIAKRYLRICDIRRRLSGYNADLFLRTTNCNSDPAAQRLTMPSNGSTANALPQFQWSAVGGQKYKLTLAKLQPNQTQEDALNNSSQRMVLNLTSTSSNDRRRLHGCRR